MSCLGSSLHQKLLTRVLLIADRRHCREVSTLPASLCTQYDRLRSGPVLRAIDTRTRPTLHECATPSTFASAEPGRVLRPKLIVRRSACAHLCWRWRLAGHGPHQLPREGGGDSRQRWLCGRDSTPSACRVRALVSTNLSRPAVSGGSCSSHRCHQGCPLLDATHPFATDCLLWACRSLVAR